MVDGCTNVVGPLMASENINFSNNVSIFHSPVVCCDGGRTVHHAVPKFFKLIVVAFCCLGCT